VNASGDVLLWLESPEGEKWSRSRHAPLPFSLVTVKDDDPGEMEWAAFIWYNEFAIELELNRNETDHWWEYAS
jgi:hypothetical protein